MKPHGSCIADTSTLPPTWPEEALDLGLPLLPDGQLQLGSKLQRQAVRTLQVEAVQHTQNSNKRTMQLLQHYVLRSLLRSRRTASAGAATRASTGSRLVVCLAATLIAVGAAAAEELVAPAMLLTHQRARNYNCALPAAANTDSSINCSKQTDVIDGSSTHVHDLLPQACQCGAHLLGWVALTAKAPDLVQSLVKVLLITIPGSSSGGSSSSSSSNSDGITGMQ
jgi:hypothetical protein